MFYKQIASLYTKQMSNLKQIVIDALYKAYEVHQSLGASGEEVVQKNQFAQVALRVDIECEQAVLQTLQENTLAIKVISEEHGTTLIGNSQEYLGVLDGLDGSMLYKTNRGKKRYGTMFAIFDTTNPTYSDYRVCGIMQHATNRLFIAEKDKGAYILENNQEKPIHTSSKTQLGSNTKIYIDEYFEYNRTTFSQHLSEFEPKYELASSLYYADLAEGTADLVLECTRKGNLEIAVEYGLTTEAGGSVIDLEGHDIAHQSYLSFGQDEQVGIISAATHSLALDLLKKIRQ